MNKSKYPTDGFAAFAVAGKVRVVGPVKKDVPFYWVANVDPLFAETEPELLALIAAKGYTINPIS
jgi:hypothetical protein